MNGRAGPEVPVRGLVMTYRYLPRPPAPPGARSGYGIPQGCCPVLSRRAGAGYWRAFGGGVFFARPGFRPISCGQPACRPGPEVFAGKVVADLLPDKGVNIFAVYILPTPVPGLVAEYFVPRQFGRLTDMPGEPGFLHRHFPLLPRFALVFKAYTMHVPSAILPFDNSHPRTLTFVTPISGEGY